MRETSAGRTSGAGVDRDDARHAEYWWEHMARPPGQTLPQRLRTRASACPSSQDRGCDSPSAELGDERASPVRLDHTIPQSVEECERLHRDAEPETDGSKRGAVVGHWTTSARMRTRAPWPAGRPRAAVGLRLPLGSRPDGSIAFAMARWTQCRGTLLLIRHMELVDRSVTDYGRLRRC